MAVFTRVGDRDDRSDVSHRPIRSAMTAFQYQTSDLEAMAGLDGYYTWILDEIRPFLGTHMAEIGAGIGTFTDILAREHVHPRPNCQLRAFEPAGNLYPRLRENLASKHPDLVRASRLDTSNAYFQPSGAEFDTLIMINVLEHIADDAQGIRLAHDSLEAGGTLVVFTPALPCLFSAFDKAVGHHRRYKKEELRRLFLDNGFTVLKLKYMDCLGVCPWYLRFVVGGSLSINPGLARTYDKWFVPVTRCVETLWEPWIGKNLLVVGQKNSPA